MPTWRASFLNPRTRGGVVEEDHHPVARESLEGSWRAEDQLAHLGMVLTQHLDQRLGLGVSAKAVNPRTSRKTTTTSGQWGFQAWMGSSPPHLRQRRPVAEAAASSPRATRPRQMTVAPPAAPGRALRLDAMLAQEPVKGLAVDTRRLRGLRDVATVTVQEMGQVLVREGLEPGLARLRQRQVSVLSLIHI